MTSACLTFLLTSVVAINYFMTLPVPEAVASIKTVESYADSKRSMYFPVAVVAFIEVPIVVAAARFVSEYPPNPLTFTWSIGIIASFAVVAHIETKPVKGPTNIGLELLVVIGAAFFLTFFGFHNDNRGRSKPVSGP